jgi:hypothetical protein
MTKKSKKYNKIGPWLFLLLFVVLLVVLILSINAYLDPQADPTGAPSSSEEPKTPLSSITAETGSPAPPPIESLLPSLEPTPDFSGPDVPYRATPADDAFFAAAAFIGNSLVDGFRLFSGLTSCDIYAATSMTVGGADTSESITLDSGVKGTILDALKQKPYGKIYILLGINEIGYDADYFKDLYGALLDKISELQPDATIYIMGLTPVSAHKSSTSDIFTMTRVNIYNEKLFELAGEKHCYYIDLCEALAGDDGYLPSGVTSDGVHFSASEYKIWLEYLRHHYI